MTHVTERFARGGPVFSFEFYPPKADDGTRALLSTLRDLKDSVSPDYVSVTYGAGGSTREKTHEIVVRIQAEVGIPSVAHLTCVGATVGEIDRVVDQMADAGIQNFLALRGDAPQGQEGFVAAAGGFAHASELIAHLAKRPSLCIGAAAYPEVHPESKSAAEDLSWTLHKVDQGARFLVTQLFFDNRHYFDFVERLDQAGCRVPVVPGIMPITNVAQIERFTRMCGASIPSRLQERMDAWKDDPAAVMAVGIEHAIEQCRGLLRGGAPGLHFYTLNKSLATRSILAALKGLA